MKELKSYSEEFAVAFELLVISWSCFSESRKPSRWDTSKQEKKEDSISEFLSLARSKVDSPKPEPSPLTKKEEEPAVESSSDQVFGAPRLISGP